MRDILLSAVPACLAALLLIAIGLYIKAQAADLEFALGQIESGNLDLRLQNNSRLTEFDHLHEQFNRMAMALQTERDRLVHLEKVSAWKEIAQRMAHEIKNPLTPIQLTVEQIRDTYRGDDPKYKSLLADSAQIILEEIENLRLLTKEFTDFARLPQLQFAPVRLHELLQEASGMYSSPTVKLQCPPSLVIDADREGLRRVLFNLIENARNAVEGLADPKIIIDCQEEDSGVRIEVTDNGHGISREDQPRIFEPHFSTRKAGMGLGLAIVKSIIDEHRGQISVESVENRGTTFRVFLRKQIKFVTDEESV